MLVIVLLDRERRPRRCPCWRSIIRDVHGAPVVDVTIDMATGHFTGFSLVAKERETYDERAELTGDIY